MKKKSTKLILLRILLSCLILLNMAMIFSFSAEDGKTSIETAEKVESAILETVLPGTGTDTSHLSDTFLSSLEIFVRKSAHVIEFCTLSALICALALTFPIHELLACAISLGGTLLYAISDEIHQSFVDGRSSSATDVLFDMLGAFIGTGAVFLICILYRRRRFKLKTTLYRLPLRHPKPLRIALASDLHGDGIAETLSALRSLSPDLILIPGDLTDDEGLADPEGSAYTFLEECAHIAPTYYSVGNHEIACYHRGNPFRHPTPIPLSDEIKRSIGESGAVLLDNDCVTADGLCICGLTSGINKKENRPNPEALARFANEQGTRILLCHHPEYFVPYIQKTDIDLTVCGHAHGGQWRLFGRGIYSPGQGLFPKYTAGVLDGRCVISRGIGNHTSIPRIFNTPELILIETEPTP